MPPHAGVLIVGANPEGLQAALTLARLGERVTLIHPDRDFGRPPSHWGEGARRWHRHLLKQVSYHPLVEIRTEIEVAKADSGEQGVQVHWVRSPQWVVPELCVACGKCEGACPAELPDGRKPISRLAAPNAVAIDKRKPSPCRSTCPLQMNVQGYAALIARGRLQDAAEFILGENPLPGVCGRICHHPCEAECRRQEIDDPIAICALKRFVSDRARKSRKPQTNTDPPAPDGPRVAIIGSGPAGLTAAHDLARAGLRPTLVEAEARPGGLLRQAIAPYRLPRAVLDQEISRILAMGAELRSGTPIRSWRDLEGLKADGFQAILLATGASVDQPMNLRGEDLEGIHGCVAFLTRLWRGSPVGLLGRVAVIGGGNAAVEAARASVRAGARSVTIVYRRGRKEMPADPHEVAQALEEGVRLRCLSLPTAFEGKDGRLAGIRCVKMMLEGIDPSGRPRPVPIHGSDFHVRADTAIISIGQRSDLAYVTGGDLRVTRWGAVAAEDRDVTNVPGIYAAGDLVSGPSTVVEAMASGRRAAQAIIKDLMPAQALPASGAVETPVAGYDPISRSTPTKGRRPIPVRNASERIADYHEVIGALSRKEATEEASRCLQCGVCAECLKCEASCELGAISHRRMAVQESSTFHRVIVTDEEQPFPGMDNPLVIGAPPFGRNRSVAEAAVRGRVAAMDAWSGRSHAGNRTAAGASARETERRIGLFVCSCNGTLNEEGQVDRVISLLAKDPAIAHAEAISSACHPREGRRIEDGIRQNGLSGALIASCACCHLDFACDSCTDQRMRLKHRLFTHGGFQPWDVALVNVKETALLPHKARPDVGIDLAARAIRAGLLQLVDGGPGPIRTERPHLQALVLGVSDGGIAAARGLRDRLPSVVVVDPGGVARDTQEGLRGDGIQLLGGITPIRIQGQWGSFTLMVEEREGEAPGCRSVNAGVVILGREEYMGIPYKRDPFAQDSKIAGRRTWAGLETGVPGVFVTWWTRAGKLSRMTLGRAAASEALERLLGVGNPNAFLGAWVDPELCRGCGRCAQICPDGAARLEASTRGVATSWIEPRLCRGCGGCLAECPTGAIRMPDSGPRYLERLTHVLLG